MDEILYAVSSYLSFAEVYLLYMTISHSNVFIKCSNSMYKVSSASSTDTAGLSWAIQNKIYIQSIELTLHSSSTTETIIDLLNSFIELTKICSTTPDIVKPTLHLRFHFDLKDVDFYPCHITTFCRYFAHKIGEQLITFCLSDYEGNRYYRYSLLVDGDLINLIDNCKNVTDLDLARCYFLTDESLQRLVEMQKLVILSLDQTYYSINTLYNIIDSCNQLALVYAPRYNSTCTRLAFRKDMNIISGYPYYEYFEQGNHTDDLEFEVQHTKKNLSKLYELLPNYIKNNLNLLKSDTNEVNCRIIPTFWNYI